MVAESRGGLTKQGALVMLFHRRGGILPRSRRLERIASRLNLALDVSRFAAGTEQILKSVIVWFEVIVGDTPVLDLDVRCEEARAVPFPRAGGELKIICLKPIGLAVPVHHRSAETGAG